MCLDLGDRYQTLLRIKQLVLLLTGNTTSSVELINSLRIMLGMRNQVSSITIWKTEIRSWRRI